MAGDWMKLELETPNKPEIFRLSTALNISKDEVVGKLVRFWGWFNQHSVDGCEPADTAFMLDDMLQCDGFCNALIDVDWMTTDGESIQVSKFDRHNSKGAKQRGMSNRRVAKHREKKKQAADGNANVTQLPLQERIPEKRIEENRRDTPEKKRGGGGGLDELEMEVKK